MESQTKNRQTPETIRCMVRGAFGNADISGITELTEGFFNVAYLVALPGGKEVILKIAPPEGSLIMTHEKDIMRCEAESMRLVKSRTDVPVADILFYDHTRTVCDADYFFMSKLEGKTLSSLSGELSGRDKSGIQYSLGRYNAQINGITGESFGYFCQPEKHSADWHTAFSTIIRDALNDAKAMSIDIGVPYGAVAALLPHFTDCFREVRTPRLVHWDLWDGNVFIKDGQISGLIDFERCLWADCLMEVGFRSSNQDRDFLKGYGIGAFTEKQKARILWYDLYLFLISSLEYDYRKYPDDGILRWASGKVAETFARIKALPSEPA